MLASVFLRKLPQWEEIFVRNECCQTIDLFFIGFCCCCCCFGFFLLLLYSVGRLCCPAFPVAVCVRCLISAERIREDENDKVFSGQLPLYVVGAQKTGACQKGALDGHCCCGTLALPILGVALLVREVSCLPLLLMIA